MSFPRAAEKFSYATGTNVDYIEGLYASYKKDPQSVEDSWRKFFEGYDFAASNAFGGSSSGGEEGKQSAKVEALINAYRVLGHMSADLNPLAKSATLNSNMDPATHGLAGTPADAVVHPANFGSPDMKFGDVLAMLRDTYCGKIGADYRELNDIDMVVWIQKKMEACKNKPSISSETKKSILHYLTLAEGFERFLQDRYLGQKRFSLEGNDSLMPLLHYVSEHCALNGVEELNLGMAHRGRLNVLTNFMGKHPELILKEFEGTEYNQFDIDGDVKYHMGFCNEIKTPSGKNMRVFLLPNPSHLEAVNPVVEGFSRGRQAELKDTERTKVCPILIHGDAAFMGQGVVSETLNLSELAAFGTGGTIHIIIDNQVGFTADPRESRTGRYSSEIAKMIRAPVFHVNADDPEAVVWVAQLASEFRQKFHKDVVIDLIGYRRHGHNETDEPMYTQPLLYKVIKSHPTCLTMYSEKLAAENVASVDVSKDMMKTYRDHLQESMERVRAGKSTMKPEIPKSFAKIMAYKKADRDDFERTVDTGISEKDLKSIAGSINSIPKSFNAHPKVGKLVEGRVQMMEGNGTIDWGLAELLAYGSLLKGGYPVRLSGQDCQRGTFSHRHAVVKDFETGKELSLLNQVGGAESEVINSALSENGVMGFEFGFSVAKPEGLTIWEAQFGDFCNGAQIIIDQFLAASEAKWKQTSGLVLLLPHGYEGQGPEHSNARPERFLQLSGNLNIQVCNPTTPAQLFHMLRRQVLRSFRKPLIVMSPKSLLRHPKVISTVKDLSKGSFMEVMDDAEVKDPSKVKRILVCSGKLFYELADAREKNSANNVAIIRLEQLYPFPEKALTAILKTYPKATEMVWTQEEPMNMGAWYFARHRLEQVVDGRLEVLYAGRKGSGSTAEGSNKAHVKEQQRIINAAFGDPKAEKTTA